MKKERQGGSGVTAARAFRLPLGESCTKRALLGFRLVLHSAGTGRGRRRRARCVRLLGFPVGEAVAAATDEGLRKAKHLTMLCRLP